MYFKRIFSCRFFSALYKKLLDPNVTQTAHQAMFLSLVYKALSKDTQIDRVKVFIKRLLQVHHIYSYLLD